MIPPVGSSDSLPQIDRSAMPAEVRKGSKEDQKLFKTALAFERQLLSQLTESMNRASGGGDEEGEDSGDGAGGAYKSMVPTALADSIVQRGGTGMALDLYRSFNRGDQK